MTLPPFPVDDNTLDLLYAAVCPDWDAAERSSLYDVCVLYSRLGGSDTDAVESVEGNIHVMRDPQYHHSDVIAALIEEIRRLRRTGEDDTKEAPNG